MHFRGAVRRLAKQRVAQAASTRHLYATNYATTPSSKSIRRQLRTVIPEAAEESGELGRKRLFGLVVGELGRHGTVRLGRVPQRAQQAACGGKVALSLNQNLQIEGGFENHGNPDA